MVDRALEIAYNFLYGSVAGKNQRSYLFNPVKTALNCNTQQEKIVALFHSDPPLVHDQRELENLKEEGFASDITDAIACLMKLRKHHQRKREDYDHFMKRIVTDDIAFQVVKIQDQVKDENKENPINNALEIAWENHSEQLDKNGKSYILYLIKKALHCNTEDEKIGVLLHDDTTNEIKLIKDIKK
ncbi:MAG TPA: hypothetical protein GXX42_12830 [Petrimonas sp.]|nr:hypothetical protein [Petrimonas sp.]